MNFGPPRNLLLGTQSYARASALAKGAHAERRRSSRLPARRIRRSRPVVIMTLRLASAYKTILQDGCGFYGRCGARAAIAGQPRHRVPWEPQPPRPASPDRGPTRVGVRFRGFPAEEAEFQSPLPLNNRCQNQGAGEQALRGSPPPGPWFRRLPMRGPAQIRQQGGAGISSVSGAANSSRAIGHGPAGGPTPCLLGRRLGLAFDEAKCSSLQQAAGCGQTGCGPGQQSLRAAIRVRRSHPQCLTPPPSCTANFDGRRWQGRRPP